MTNLPEKYTNRIDVLCNLVLKRLYKSEVCPHKTRECSWTGNSLGGECCSGSPSTVLSFACSEGTVLLSEKCKQTDKRLKI